MTFEGARGASFILLLLPTPPANIRKRVLCTHFFGFRFLCRFGGLTRTDTLLRCELLSSSCEPIESTIHYK